MAFNQPCHCERSAAISWILVQTQKRLFVFPAMTGVAVYVSANPSQALLII